MRTGAEAVRELLERQQAWARARELPFDGEDRLSHADANGFRPLSPAARRAWAGRLPRAGKPGDLQHLLCREALLASLLDAPRPHGGETWRAAATACGAPDATRARFDVAPTDGDEARVDALLESDAARPVALVLRYAEPYAGAVERLRAAEVDEDGAAWGLLSMCRALARELRARPLRFERVPAVALLRAARALTARFGPRGFRLVYVAPEPPGPAGRAHRRELDRLRMRVGGEVDLLARRLDAVLEALAADPRADRAQAAWLRERYRGS